MPDPVSATVGSSVVGLYGANKAARSQQAAADRSAAAQIEAARIQAEASKFRPVGVTTAFGGTRYKVGPEGYLTEAGYELTPELKAQQEQLLGLAPGALTSALATDQYYGDLARRYAGLGEQALAGIQMDPMQAAQERVARMQALAEPGRAEAEQRLFSNLAAKGLTGIAVEGGTGARVNPYMAALAQEQEQQNKAMALEALTQAQSDIDKQLARGTGLFGTGQSYEQYQAGRLAQQMAPYQALLGQAQTLESLGGGALDIGTALAARERTAAQTAGSAIGQGMTGAARTQAAGATAAARQQAAMFGGLASQIQNFDYSQLGGGGDTGGFRFYNAPQGSAPYSLTQQASSFAPTSAAGSYANNFQFSLLPQMNVTAQPTSSQQAFALPNYRPNIQASPYVSDPFANLTTYP